MSDGLKIAIIGDYNLSLGIPENSKMSQEFLHFSNIYQAILQIHTGAQENLESPKSALTSFLGICTKF